MQLQLNNHMNTKRTPFAISQFDIMYNSTACLTVIRNIPQGGYGIGMSEGCRQSYIPISPSGMLHFGQSVRKSVKPTRLKRISEQFRIRGAIVWNYIPVEVRNAKSIMDFKNGLLRLDIFVHDTLLQ